MNLLDAIYVPAAVLSAPWWARKTRGGWKQRFGHISPLPPKPPGTHRVLLHAVSVGEVGTLRKLVPTLRAKGVEVVISASTDTGLARAQELFAATPGVFVVRFALDFSPAVRRFLDATDPDVIGLVELEVWPNFVRECTRRKIPVGVINGRLSARSFAGYARFKQFIGPTFAALSFVGAQDEDYARRFAAMGVAPGKLSITGSMKWDAVDMLSPGETLPGADALAQELGIDRSQPMVVLGSSAQLPDDPGSEEALVDRAIRQALGERVSLLCAPRKPEHRPTAHAALGGPEHCTLRSTKRPAAPGVNRFLLDTIGELRTAYALGTIAIIGRSFGDLGGSDPIEPIALGIPTIMGPSAANFSQVVKLLHAQGAIRVCTRSELGQVISELLASPALRECMTNRGREVIRYQQGATQRHAELILNAIAAQR